jgi:hypothetical protein
MFGADEFHSVLGWSRSWDISTEWWEGVHDWTHVSCAIFVWLCMNWLCKLLVSCGPHVSTILLTILSSSSLRSFICIFAPEFSCFPKFNGQNFRYPPTDLDLGIPIIKVSPTPNACVLLAMEVCHYQVGMMVKLSGVIFSTAVSSDIVTSSWEKWDANEVRKPAKRLK